MAIVTSALARIKCDPLAMLGGAELVNDCFAQSGHVWREKVLTPAVTIKLFIVQILHGNVAISALRHLSQVDVADSSYCDARGRLPLAGFAAMISTLCSIVTQCSEDPGRWRGRRVVMADATSTITPDMPALQEQWPQPSAQKDGCGFPLVKLLGLLDCATGMFSQLSGMHAALCAGDVLLADRGFCSFAHLAMLAKYSADAVFRMHQRQIVDFTPHRRHRGKADCGKKRRARGTGKARPARGIPASRFVRRLGQEDQIVEWIKPKPRPTWMTPAHFAALPETLTVRELRYRVIVLGHRTRVVTIATTLLDPMRYPKREIAELYGIRWEIETNFRHLKTTMKMEQLKCQSVEGCLKELMIYVLVYNLVRAAMLLAAQRQGVDDANRISFIDALRWLASAWKERAGLIPRLRVNKRRQGRWAPRVKKRRMKEYDLMNRPRHAYAQPTEVTEVEA